jgi:hypothetical protein
MNVQLFQKIAEALLQNHYGLTLGDTRLNEPQYVAVVMGSATRPFEYLIAHARDCDLRRIDGDTLLGCSTTAAITMRHELSVLADINPIVLLSERPVVCGSCGSRTDFDVLEQGLGKQKPPRQYHRCLNTTCGNEFIAEDEIVSVAVELNTGYADSIIEGSPEGYDALEIHGVRDFHEPNDPAGTCCEVDDVNPQFFSVYVHLKMGGIECVGDFGTPLLAMEYARSLAEQYGWPVLDYVSVSSQQKLAAQLDGNQ